MHLTESIMLCNQNKGGNKMLKKIIKMVLIVIAIFLLIVGVFGIGRFTKEGDFENVEEKLERSDIIVKVRYIKYGKMMNDLPANTEKDKGYLVLKDGNVEEFDVLNSVIKKSDINMTDDEIEKIEKLIKEVDENAFLPRMTSSAVSSGTIIDVYDGSQKINLSDFYGSNSSPAASEILQILMAKHIL